MSERGERSDGRRARALSHPSDHYLCLVEEAKDLATGVLATRLLVVHDAERGCQHDVSELLQKNGPAGGGGWGGGQEEARA